MTETFVPEPCNTVRTFRGSIESLDARGCMIRYPYDVAWCNPKGSIQGGILAVFLDDCMSYAVLGVLGVSARFSTVNMSIDYLSAVNSGDMDAHGVVTRAGSRILFLEGRIENNGRTVARATSSAMLLDGSGSSASASNGGTSA